MTDIEQDDKDKLFFEAIFDMTIAYLDTLKELDNDPHLFASLAGMESALNTVMPLIKQRLVAEMEAEGYKRDVFMTPDEVEIVEELVGIVERFEL